MKIIEISPLVRRITADNGGVFTGGGTNTYLVGHQEITVIDPGPASPEHVENIAKICGEDIKQILVTHTHNDHSPGQNYFIKGQLHPLWVCILCIRKCKTLLSRQKKN